MATTDDLLIEYANHEILKGKKGRKQTENLNDKRKRIKGKNGQKRGRKELMKKRDWKIESKTKKKERVGRWSWLKHI